MPRRASRSALILPLDGGSCATTGYAFRALLDPLQSREQAINKCYEENAAGDAAEPARGRVVLIRYLLCTIRRVPRLQVIDRILLHQSLSSYYKRDRKMWE